MNKIFVASDGSGRTAEQALNAALAQFPGAELEIIIRSKVRTKKRVEEVVEEAAKAKGFIVHTIVTDSIREYLAKLCRDYNVETIDLMGPLIARLSETLATTPTEKPGLFGRLNKSYFRRIESMEFAIRHDDGQRVEDLHKAEIVLLGVSRTFKTPLSIYFAFKGWFVANVPITIEQTPPGILQELFPERVFCLDTNARQLAGLRQARHNYLKGVTQDYTDQEYVRIELMHARQFYAKNLKWSIVNVTNKPIEEIASEILTIMGYSGRGRDNKLL
ncbi:pyruvate, water dikinase regulatory protein [Bacteroidota bacterium]